MSGNGAPANKDDPGDAKDDDDDITVRFSTLNVHALEFVPYSYRAPQDPCSSQSSSSQPEYHATASTSVAGTSRPSGPVYVACDDSEETDEEMRDLTTTAAPRVEDPPPVPPAIFLKPKSKARTSTRYSSGVGIPEAIPGPSRLSKPYHSPPKTPRGASSSESEKECRVTPESHFKRVSQEMEHDRCEMPKKNYKKKKRRIQDTSSSKEHVNLVLIGHVDAGKSTIGGQIMSLTGMVDKRTLKKYEKEAREKSRESWYLSWALDTNQEEREKGKTVEVGRAYFETEKKHFTILDAPGHKSFVPNMICGAAQADLAILVISARKGEFETGFDKGGQTREHAMLARTAGVKHLVAVVNKMDDPTVSWNEERYNECHDKILPYLKKLGFNPAKDLSFLPVSGLTGHGLLHPIPKDICPWYNGPSFIQLIDELPSFDRKIDAPFIMPVVDKYKDMGTVLMGKVEAGITRKGDSLLLMPNRVTVTVDQLWSDDVEVTSIAPGENVKVKLKGIEEEEVSPGFVLCDFLEPVSTGKVFDAQVVILEYKSIVCPGYSAVMHIHCAVEVVNVRALFCLVDKKTGEKSKTRPRFVKQDQVAIMRLDCAGVICMEPFKNFAQLGRFTLRDENKTIAIGKVLKVIE